LPGERSGQGLTLEHQAEADRLSNAAAATLSVTLPGDAVLYLLLPLHAAVFGVTLPESGVLLAVNRLIRIVGYGWVARSFARYGARRTCGVATLGAVLSTLGYAGLSGLWWLLIARLVWGLSFAALNIATQALATSVPEGAARRSGRSRAIIALGPMIGLLGGAALSIAAGPRVVFLVLGLIGIVGFFFVMKLPGGHGTNVSGRPRFALPERLDVWSFTQGLTLDGLFVIGLSILAAAVLPGEAALAAGAALALRYAAEIVLGPAGGAVADRWGARQLLVVLSILSAIALVAIGFGWVWTGAIAVVLLRGLLQPLAAPVAAQQHSGAGRVPAIARVATWRDIGAGVGPLLAGVLLPIVAPQILYGVAGLMLAAAALGVWWMRRERVRHEDESSKLA
jgi:predicted MFS family arabinose efflux permease